MRPPSSPLARRSTTDIVRFVIVASVIMAVVVTMERIQYLQSVLDGFNCCISDVPMLLARTPRSFSPSLPRFSRSGATANQDQEQRLNEAPIVHYQQTNSTCLQHTPIYLNVSKVNLNSSAPVLLHPQAATCGRLRRHWTRNPIQSPLAKMIEATQTNCALPVATYHMDNNFGFGSHLNVWSQAMCNAMEANQRLQTYNPNWLWMDQGYCRLEHPQQSPLLCYFPQTEQRCRIDTNSHHQENSRALNTPAAVAGTAITTTATLNVTDPRKVRKRCTRVRDKDGLAAFRTASMEYIFQQLSPVVIQEAQRQIGLLFGSSPPSSSLSSAESSVPRNLITVHMRYGDKFFEMDLPSGEEYVQAVQTLLATNTTSGSSENHHHHHPVNIYLATEDPLAVAAFQKAAPSEWKIYVDRTVVELDDFRPKKGNRASWTTRNTRGRAGLVALGSLLVALEADWFVLTTQSNWSRLMDELRRTIVDRQCGNCTKMIDLRPGQW